MIEGDSPWSSMMAWRRDVLLYLPGCGAQVERRVGGDVTMMGAGRRRRVMGIALLLPVMFLSSGCFLKRFALGREYILVNLGAFREPGPSAAPCDEVRMLQVSTPNAHPVWTVVCRFHGIGPTPPSAPQGIRPFFRVLTETTESSLFHSTHSRLSVIRPDGFREATKQPKVGTIPYEVLQACRPPSLLYSNRTFGAPPLTAAEASQINELERCLEPKL